MSPTGPRCARLERPFGLACAVRLARSFTLLLVVWLAGAAAVHAQQNLSFEALDAGGMPLGWSASDGAEVTSDATATADGERSLQVTRASEAGATRVTQRAAAAQLRVDGDPRACSACASRVRSEQRRPARPARSGSASTGRAARYSSIATATVVSRTRSESRGWRPPTGNDPEWRHYELELPLPGDVEEIAFGVSVRGAGTVWFDALELTAVATDSAPPATLAAARYVEAALALMREHSLRRAEVDWPVLREQALEYARGATTPAEAHLAVRFAVRALGDRHSYLQSPAVTRELANDRGGERPHGRGTGRAARPPLRQRRAPARAELRGRHSGPASRVRRVVEEHHSTAMTRQGFAVGSSTCGRTPAATSGRCSRGWGPCSRRASSRHPSTPTAGGSPSGTGTVKPGSATTRSCECARRIECERPRRSRCCLGPLRPAPPRCWPWRCAVAPRRARSARPRGA